MIETPIYDQLVATQDLLEPGRYGPEPRDPVTAYAYGRVPAWESDYASGTQARHAVGQHRAA